MPLILQGGLMTQYLKRALHMNVKNVRRNVDSFRWKKVTKETQPQRPKRVTHHERQQLSLMRLLNNIISITVQAEVEMFSLKKPSGSHRRVKDGRWKTFQWLLRNDSVFVLMKKRHFRFFFCGGLFSHGSIHWQIPCYIMQRWEKMWLNGLARALHRRKVGTRPAYSFGKAAN